MTLRNARILSSCNDASNKQEQKMNVNIKLEDKLPQQSQQSFANVPFYPQVPPANFTTPESMTPQPSQPSAGEFVQYPSTATSQTSQQIPTINRSIDLSGDILQKIYKLLTWKIKINSYNFYYEFIKTIHYILIL